MRFRKLRDRIHVEAVLGSLLLIHTVLLPGCSWAPDIVIPSHPEFEESLEGSYLYKKSFALPRRFQVEGGNIKATFQLDKKARAVWFEEFSFGNSAAQWRFTLFAPGGKIICGNKWTDTSQNSITCHNLDPKYVSTPLSADIDFILDGQPTGPNAPFGSTGRVIYLVEPAPVGERGLGLSP